MAETFLQLNRDIATYFKLKANIETLKVEKAKCQKRYQQSLEVSTIGVYDVEEANEIFKSYQQRNDCDDHILSLEKELQSCEEVLVSYLKALNGGSIKYENTPRSEIYYFKLVDSKVVANKL